MNFLILTSKVAVGGVWFLALFLLTFASVHICKLAKIGWKLSVSRPTAKPQPAEKQEKTEKALAKPQEPVYYVIERQRKKPKTTYSEPKQITFK